MKPGKNMEKAARSEDSMAEPQKRLAIYLPTLVGGGAERVLLNLADGFAQRGYPVDFVLAQREGAFSDAVPDSVRLIELNTRQLKFGRSIFSIPALVRYIRRERPAALLTGLHANIIAVWAKLLAGVPFRLVISEHNTFSLQNQMLPVGLRQLNYWLIRWNYPRADRIVAVSEGAADDLAVSARISRDKIKVIINPIITPELKAKVKEDVDHPWFKPGEPPVILAVGRLTSQKDYPLLIQAFKKVRQSTPARLLILGDGEEREKLAALIHQLGLEKDASLPGFDHNPYKYMAHASVFALSSRWEGLPTVLVEALYCGARLVSTDCPSGPREILHGGQFGKLVPVGDVDALSKAILDSLHDGKAQPPEESWQPFELDVVVDQYLKLLTGD
jgi:glycosyltransferase involved in cell wall biosynthesis